MWYPGHIEKAKKRIRSNLKIVDAVVELLDARIPFSSRAYEYDELFQNKQRILVLNKEDLADPEITRLWTNYYKENYDVISANLKRSDARSFLQRKILPKIKGKFLEKKIMIVGVPNVGKSTLINRIKGKKSLAVGNRPGITRGIQWIKINEQLSVLDTPGILYTRLHSPNIKMKLIATGCLPLEQVDLFDAIKKIYSFLKTRYGKNVFTSVLENCKEEHQNYEGFLELYSREKGFIKRGQEYDYERAAAHFLINLTKGNFGRFSYETPDDIEILNNG
ncbi:MAG: ribosome biogenesis GTPase YlqF [Kosmotoga sp.]|nr:MAG: ribosome biogenesis GTPase YlqF [Kosmotoga sp.]